MNHRLLIQSTRIFLDVIVVTLVVLQHLIQEEFFNWGLYATFYAIAAASALLHLLPLFSLDRFFDKPKLVGLTFGIDVILISLLMGASGLSPSLFLFLYLVTIILTGLVFQLRGALLAAALSSICFTVASWFGPEVKAMSFLFLLILNNLAFFAVAWLAGYLSDQLNLFQERLQAQNLSLRVIRRLNELIVDTMPAGLLIVNQDGQVLQANPGAQNLFQLDGLEGENLFSFVPELKNQIPDLSRVERSVRFEVKYSRITEVYLLGLQVLPQTSDLNEQTYLIVIEDLTQIRKLEFAVRQSEKMAAVGQLAAGIAHEIRNPLAGISGSIELLSQQFSTEDDKKLTKIILREIDRLNNLISEFLDFAKPEKPPVDTVDLNHVLREVIDHANLSSPVKVEVNAQWASDGLIVGHRDKLKQAFLNIVINSFQAMGLSENKKLFVRSEESGDSLVVRIKDSGCGMRLETKKRMFEPFHTTKPKGTGLGLAITHKILESHQAKIFVESEEGLGTEFVVTFPRKIIDQANSQIENKI